jgi:WD40 repeat protein
MVVASRAPVFAKINKGSPRSGSIRLGAESWPFESTAVRPLRLRFTMRRLMIIVAVIAVVVWCFRPAGRPRPSFITSQYGYVHALALTPGEQWLATGGVGDISSHQSNGVVSLIDLATGRPRWFYKCGNSDQRVEAIRISADGRTLIAQNAHSLRFLDVASGRLLQQLAGLSGSSGCQTLSQDASLGAWASEAGIKLQDVASGQQIRTLIAAPCGVVEFSPDAKLLASAEGRMGDGSRTDDVTLWDVNSGKRSATLKSQCRAIRELAFAPDGKALAVASGHGGAIELWDLTSGRLTGRLKLDVRSTRAIKFSPDSKTLVSVDSGLSLLDEITFWDVSTCKPRGHASTGKEMVSWRLLFMDGGSILLAGCEDGTILIRDSIR